MYEGEVTELTPCETENPMGGKKFGSRTTPHEDNSPPDKNKAQPLPTRTTIPRTIPHQDNSPLGPLPVGIKPLIRTKTCTVGNCPPGELSGYEEICVYPDCMTPHD